MIPTWLNDTVRGFGRQLGLQTLELNDGGVAGIAFENGLNLRLEYAKNALTTYVALAVQPSGDAVRAFLAEVHFAAGDGRGGAIRAGCLPSTGEPFLAIRLAEREVNVAAMETVFRRLWERAERLRRVIG